MKNWMKNNKSVVVLITMFSLLFGLLFVGKLLPEGEPTEVTPYVTFIENLEDGTVKEIEYSYSNENMTVTLDDGTTYDTAFPGSENFRKEMLEAGVELSIADAEGSINIISLIGNVITWGIMGVFLIYMFKMMKDQMGTADFSEKSLVQTSTVKFEDVIGQDEIVEDVKFAVNILKNPEIGSEFGAKPPKGILFEGGPGCGKTMIAKAVAGEAGVPFISVSGASFVEKYVGVGASRVRTAFKVARKNAPCVLFIDEIDAVGMARGTGGTSERDQTINAMLTEMDGFTGREGILVIAATNRADMLDEALVRSGRFDRKITISKPKNWNVRADLFKHYLEGKKLAEDVNIECIAKQTAGYSGADIASVCNEACNIALQRGLKFITMDCLEEAVDKKVFGGNRVKSKEERNHDKEIVAFHEAGHAVVTYLLGKPIARASIIGTTSGVGGAVFREDEDSQFMTKRSAEDFVKIAYGGRASEEIKFGEGNITTGASNDITQATKVLTSAIVRYGFYTEKAGMLDVSVLKDCGLSSGETEALKLVQSESSRLYEETKAMLFENYGMVKVLAEALLEQETMSGNEVCELLNNSLATPQVVLMSDLSEEERKELVVSAFSLK